MDVLDKERGSNVYWYLSAETFQRKRNCNVRNDKLKVFGKGSKRDPLADTCAGQREGMEKWRRKAIDKASLDSKRKI